MKGKKVSGSGLFFLALAVTLTGFGLGLIFDGLRDLEAAVLMNLEYEALMELLTPTAVKLLTGGGATAAGLGIGAVMLLHLIRRTARIEKEARALRERNEQAEKLLLRQEQLAHHQRLETIGTLTASIAHEFNNLLTPIMGYSMMALEKLPPEEEELYDDILEIYNASRKAKTIISRLSDLSRKNSSLTFRLVSPDEVIRKTLSVAEPAKPRKAEVKVNLNCWDQRLRANEIQLSQMLLNLILNGFHALGDAPGTLTIETSFDETHIHIRVADTGCGIPEEIRERIFEPFFTTREAGKGTGLGLAIVAQVVEDHQGQIRLESTEGSGTVFMISLPRNQEPAPLE